MMPDVLRRLPAEALEIWGQGGWGMIALAANGVILFGVAAMTYLRLMARGAGRSADRAWAAWRRNPERPRGPIERIIAGAMRHPDPAAVARFFEGVRNEQMAPFERDLRVLQVAVKAAPLLGLLGTVTGMLTTFRALAVGGGGEKTMERIASGISEALVTTETGLVMALMGLMTQIVLTRRQLAFARLLAHLETLCLQEVHRGGRAVSAPTPAASDTLPAMAGGTGP